MIVSAEVKPPPHPFYGDSYSRGMDPFHADAFEGFGEELIERIREVNPGPQRGGWFLLDGYGQEIG